MLKAMNFSRRGQHVPAETPSHQIMSDCDLGQRDQTPNRGRAAARSRLGCITCKQRHVRCDEVYPECGHCSRLQLQCRYLRPPQNHTRARRPNHQRTLLPLPTPTFSFTAVDESPLPSKFQQGGVENGLTCPLTPTSDHLAQFMSMPCFGNDFTFVLPDMDDGPTRELSENTKSQAASSYITTSGEDWGSVAHLERERDSPDPWIPISTVAETSLLEAGLVRCSPKTGWKSPDDSPTEHPMQWTDRLITFKKIMQPPAAMLMGGIKRWRRLQAYLLNIGSKNSTVRDTLLCLEDVLAHDDYDQTMGSARDARRISERYEAARDQAIKATSVEKLGDQELDEMLAVLYLLAWIQVIRPRGPQSSNSMFPSEQADIVIGSACKWNWYSRQLLSGFNSLDSKATHLGGSPLLSQKALAIVSRHPIQIISCEYEESEENFLSGKERSQSMSSSSVTDVSEHGGSTASIPAWQTVDVKEIVLRAILQPAAEWYLQTQAYFRHIGSLDKHQRSRFTPDDELEVTLVGKQIQSELRVLWAERPSVVSLSAAELSKTMAPDLAARLEEVFSVYLASYWILFVYLHRICWWHLGHTRTAQDALTETWNFFQSSYSEDGCSKTVHPALMWPVFVFGAECPDEGRRKWAVEQIKRLATPRPVLELEAGKLDMLPAFRLSRGATQNAQRAALLLETLIAKQGSTGARVDDRDLAMEMFECHFSIV
ncbi:hypothetical protein B0J13DRAFT_47535 [Dactylonectria estremocensis]|uniref:Zn(2)-C6 fungal-type domain-containing protein n=1 Tax=Dactylonectria estremocensis TaxID=1079267 RepID=A0A9P9EVA1_9HYPO|nr:hypothetical protein B0J13DRAFT_47535 [Dactylonectria estremocensis]